MTFTSNEKCRISTNDLLSSPRPGSHDATRIRPHRRLISQAVAPLNRNPCIFISRGFKWPAWSGASSGPEIWGRKREFLSFNLTLEVWVQRWVIPQHNKVAFEKKEKKKWVRQHEAESGNNLQFTLLTKLENKGGSCWCPRNNSHFLHLEDCWETPSSPSGDANPPPGRSTWQVQRRYVLIMRRRRCESSCWNLRATSGRRLVQQGLWAEDEWITLLVAPAITTQNGCRGYRQCRAHTAGERPELFSGEEGALQLMWTFMSFWKNKSLEFVA